jgi:hypothetical protein
VGAESRAGALRPQWPVLLHDGQVCLVAPSGGLPADQTAVAPSRWRLSRRPGIDERLEVIVLTLFCVRSPSPRPPWPDSARLGDNPADAELCGSVTRRGERLMADHQVATGALPGLGAPLPSRSSTADPKWRRSPRTSWSCPLDLAEAGSHVSAMPVQWVEPCDPWLLCRAPHRQLPFVVISP